MTTDFAALNAVARVIGLLLSLTAVLVLSSVLEAMQRAAPKEDFRQARNTSLIAVAVFIAPMYTFMAGSDRLLALTTLAIGCVMACWVFLLWNVWASRRPTVKLITYLGTFILYFVSGGVGLAGIGLAVYVVQTNPSNPQTSANGSYLRKYAVTADLKGRRAKEVGQQSSFTASSGQVNFGCEEAKTVAAVWEVPANSAVEGVPQATWANTDNARPIPPAIVVESSRVVATGTILGREAQRLPFGINNCPGGGHGELLVTGTYVTRVTQNEPYTESLAAALSSFPEAAREIMLTLPSRRDVSLEAIIVTLSNAGNSESTTLPLTSPASVREQQSTSGLFTVRLEKCKTDDCLRVSLVKGKPY
jgi:hypothetical protein